MLWSGIFKHKLWIKFMSTCKIALRWIPQNTFDCQSTLVQVMAWCHVMAPSHYLNQCWPRSIHNMLWNIYWKSLSCPQFCPYNHHVSREFVIQLVLCYLPAMAVHHLVIGHLQPHWWSSSCPVYRQDFKCKSFCCWNQNILRELDQYKGSWCLGSLCCQPISSIGIEYTV